MPCQMSTPRVVSAACFRLTKSDRADLMHDFLPAVDPRPVDYLFETTPLPLVAPTSLLTSDPAFQKYQATLKKQLAGRTASLDKVLSTLEQCAATLQHNFSQVLIGEEEGSR